MMRMSKRELDHLHSIAIRYQEKSDCEPSLYSNAYAVMSIAASNLILIELALQQLEKISERQT